ncbi:endonuclease domain-containing protein [Marinihelvus fidelis]|uniref:UDP-N-acetyl-alpha-D-muramoyl-L-alanyl-L-glutamate epimerase n=1 Tax=Marinihelvus fidelis TaxID=2613842 RepID=A0A5N0TEG9_9GAMM|nr:endonuclease domain-containing protein [Marinihelvus fidelis]KAA9133380.1 endonuclease domain-containing protein [Marinihelvus fidelis]
MTSPQTAETFHFLDYGYDPATGELRMSWSFDDGPPLVERLVFPWAPWPSDASRQAAFTQVMGLLHLVAGVSYYKAGLPPVIDTGSHAIDASTAVFLETLYSRGLAEFAHVNEIDLDGRIRFGITSEYPERVTDLALPDRALVAMGGGKDSLVSLEMLRGAGIEIQPFAVGGSALIAETVAAAGLPFIRIERHLAPELQQMNAAGAWNGHVPITAINSLVGLCAALLYGYRWVVFSNEASADEATLVDDHGRAVNHQYAKSLDFETRLADLLDDRLGDGVGYFSLLRSMGEVEIARRFAGLERYHEVFSSCNRNFHIDGPRIDGRWCGDCPKCRFTTLALAPFLPPPAIERIFGRVLLDDDAQLPGFQALCALEADKPFECVGTAAESRALATALAAREEWKDRAVIRHLAPRVETGDDTLEALLARRGPHHVPADVAARVRL